MSRNRVFRVFFLFILTIFAFETTHAEFLDGDRDFENSEENVPRRNRRNNASRSSNYEYDHQRSSMRNFRKPAGINTLSNSTIKFGVTKSFYGSEGYSQTIGGYLGYSRQQTGALGYSVFGNFNLFEKNVNAARADLNMNYGFNSSFVGFAGLNINQFSGSNINGLNPGLGFQVGVDLSLKGQWGIQGVFHKLTGSVSTSNGISKSSYSFETSGIELSTYMNF